jgi:hypothetical protein
MASTFSFGNFFLLGKRQKSVDNIKDNDDTLDLMDEPEQLFFLMRSQKGMAIFDEHQLDIIAVSTRGHHDQVSDCSA